MISISYFKKCCILILLLIVVLTSASSGQIKVYLFTDPDCKSCETVKEYFKRLETNYSLAVIEFDVFTELSKLRPIIRAYDFVPRDVPITLIGNVIIEGDGGFNKYAEAIAQYKTDEFGPLLLKGKKGLVLDSPPIGAVLAGGLIDGINPCAFAAIIFMALYLSAVGKDRKTVFAVMSVFGGGVFLAYFLLGLGLREVIRRFYDIMTVRVVFDHILALVLIVLAILSFVDCFRIKQGEKGLLRISDKARRRVNTLILKAAGSKNPYPVTFLCGMAVSFIEMACTGQVYLPVIILIVKKGAAHGYVLLLLYNMMFIIPLFAVGAGVSLGITSAELRTFFKDRYVFFKASMGVLFILLTILILL